MKRCLCSILSLVLILSACLISAGCTQRPTDFVEGEEIVIDNETPFVYNESSVKYYYGKIDGKKVPYDIAFFVGALLRDKKTEYTYEYIASIFGNKIVRHYTEGGQDAYYTVYSLPNNELYYLSLCMQSGVLYLNKDILTAINQTCDARQVDMTGSVYEQDFPAVIMEDKLPSECYLENYTPEEIAENVEQEWASYYEGCNRINIPHSPDHDKNGVAYDKFIRCTHWVSFDFIHDRSDAEHGVYVYDIYTYEDGTGTLYFYHLIAQDDFRTVQKETIRLTAEEVNSVINVMSAWDFAGYPTWTPEEQVGFDGETTYIYGQGAFGGGYSRHLISMWEATSRYPHYHIRTAMENLVRAHVTVKEGRIYHPEAYE